MPLMMEIRNSSFNDKSQDILNLEFGIYGVESRIRECLNSWIPLVWGESHDYIVVKLNLIGWQCDRRFIKSDHRNFDFVSIDHERGSSIAMGSIRIVLYPSPSPSNYTLISIMFSFACQSQKQHVSQWKITCLVNKTSSLGSMEMHSYYEEGTCA